MATDDTSVVSDKRRRFCYFWRSGSPFSQWHKSPFTLDGVEFNCCEQAMMYGKAKLFGDEEAAANILQAKQPREQKALGRGVRGFSEKTWKRSRNNIVYRANMAKFSQNPALLEALMRTGDAEFVEASPSDKIWGIGLTEEKARQTPPERWPGTNLLGLALTKTRNDLRAGVTLPGVTPDGFDFVATDAALLAPCVSTDDAPMAVVSSCGVGAPGDPSLSRALSRRPSFRDAPGFDKEVLRSPAGPLSPRGGLVAGHGQQPRNGALVRLTASAPSSPASQGSHTPGGHRTRRGRRGGTPRARSPSGPSSRTYKTRLCTNWLRSHGTFCRFGDGCWFAHGPEELRSRPGDHGDDTGASAPLQLRSAPVASTDLIRRSTSAGAASAGGSGRGHFSGGDGSDIRRSISSNATAAATGGGSGGGGRSAVLVPRQYAAVAEAHVHMATGDPPAQQHPQVQYVVHTLPTGQHTAGGHHAPDTPVTWGQPHAYVMSVPVGGNGGGGGGGGGAPTGESTFSGSRLAPGPPAHPPHPPPHPSGQHHRHQHGPPAAHHLPRYSNATTMHGQPGQAQAPVPPQPHATWPVSTDGSHPAPPPPLPPPRPTASGGASRTSSLSTASPAYQPMQPPSSMAMHTTPPTPYYSLSGSPAFSSPSSVMMQRSPGSAMRSSSSAMHSPGSAMSMSPSVHDHHTLRRSSLFAPMPSPPTNLRGATPPNTTPPTATTAAGVNGRLGVHPMAAAAARPLPVRRPTPSPELCFQVQGALAQLTVADPSSRGGPSWRDQAPPLPPTRMFPTAFEGSSSGGVPAAAAAASGTASVSDGSSTSVTPDTDSSPDTTVTIRRATWNTPAPAPIASPRRGDAPPGLPAPVARPLAHAASSSSPLPGLGTTVWRSGLEGEAGASRDGGSSLLPDASHAKTWFPTPTTPPKTGDEAGAGDDFSSGCLPSDLVAMLSPSGSPALGA